MNTKLLMTFSALLMMSLGIALTFLPEEIIAMTSVGTHGDISLLFQLLGALYFAFGILNWMSRRNVIGGIYSRPIAIGNTAHFFIGGMAVLRHAGQSGDLFTWMFGIIYALLSVSFGYILFNHPGKEATVRV